jgi:hypothetical protein
VPTLPVHDFTTSGSNAYARGSSPEFREGRRSLLSAYWTSHFQGKHEPQLAQNGPTSPKWLRMAPNDPGRSLNRVQALCDAHVNTGRCSSQVSVQQQALWGSPKSSGRHRGSRKGWFASRFRKAHSPSSTLSLVASKSIPGSRCNSTAQ